MDKPWQHIQVRTAAEVASHFPCPPAEYGLVVWWGWEGPMTEEIIACDLENFQRLGFPCVMIEAGYGMSPAYLSAEWLQTVRCAVDHARRLGMRVWLVDEGKYPSGFAGGKFSEERPDLRMQGLVVSEKIDVAPGRSLTRPIETNTVGVLAVCEQDKRSQVLDIEDGHWQWEARSEAWQILVVQHGFHTAVTRSVNNPTQRKDATHSLCDYLNPEAVRQFLAFTHDQHKKYVGSEFGKTVLGFRGDEPDYAHTPWTPALPEEFERRKGYDVRPYLAAFFAPELTEEVRRVKADYWDVWSDLFRDSFFQVQADWCAEHGLEYLVHLNHEDKMMKLVRSGGDFFKAMRQVHVPGVDAIWNQIWPGETADFPKLASSAAHLFGRPRAFSESFAAYHVHPTVEQAKWVMNHQLVRGINLMEIMFYPSSANPQGRHMEWLDDESFPQVAASLNRATYLLSQGRPAAQVAVYFPTLSLWLGDKEANQSTWTIARQLLEHQRDFEFVDDGSLCDVLQWDGNALNNASGQSYRAIVVPSISTISKRAWERLKEFCDRGGAVLFLGREPSLAVETSFLSAGAPKPFEGPVREPSGELTPRVLAALPQPDIQFDAFCPSVKALHRRLQDADVYFFFNESQDKQVHQVTLLGSGGGWLWDADSGRIESIPDAVETNGIVRLALNLEPHATQFILIGAALVK